MNVRFYLSHDIKTTLKTHFFCVKMSRFFYLLRSVIMDVISNIIRSVRTLLHGVISLPDAMSCDKRFYVILSKNGEKVADWI